MHKRIIYVIGQLGFGGAERQLLELVQRLDRAKYEPTVVCLSEGAGMQSEYEKVCEVIIVKKGMRYDITRLPRLIRIFRRIKPCIVHGYLSTGVLWGTLAAKIAGVPFIVGGWRLADPNDAIRYRVINKFAGVFNHLMISNTVLMRDILVQRDGLHSGMIQVIPNGVSLDRFEDLPSTDEVRARLGLSKTAMVIGSVARFFPQKDHRTLIKAVSELCSRGIDVECLLAGDGVMKNDVEKLSHELGISRKVHLLGTCTDVPDVLKAMDVFVLSSRWEGMPNVILEAMACSKPVVATRVGGSPEVVVDGETGLLVTPGDPVVLADAVGKILSDEELRDRMGRSGRRRIEEVFTVDKMVMETEAAYDRLINKNRYGDKPWKR
ncbi:MAG: glycosyltransferase [Deltaproteobacteria bacterium]|nr:glycosyltransferase [Deltaproteobacteria bacterium]